MTRSFFSWTVGVLTASALAAGCASSPPPDPGARLAGTRWQLVSAESGSATGVATVPDPSRYTITFEAGGKAFLLLDCNRGSATWTGAGDAPSGPLGFGPVASTRMLCPQPSLGARLGADLPQMRSFEIREGRLIMTMAGGAGVYTWVPLPPPK